MKSILFLNIACFALLLFASNIFAQNPDPNSFFPHSVGNIWEYDQGWYNPDKLMSINSIENILDLSKENEIVRFEILRDSVGNDGQIYLFYGVGIFDPLWSIDTSANLVFYLPNRSNQLYYKLKADSGSSWMVIHEDSSAGRKGRRALVTNRYPSIVFGIPTELMEIEYYELYWGDTVINQYSTKINTETLASGFGLLLSFYEEPGSFNRLLQGGVIDGDTFGIITTIDDISELPENFYLSQNYPNPFNPLTQIIYELNSRQYIILKVYDLLGREVATLVEAEKPAGVYEIIFDGSSLASGVYIYRFSTNKITISKKMNLIK
jgi:hypothetical protein